MYAARPLAPVRIRLTTAITAIALIATLVAAMSSTIAEAAVTARPNLEHLPSATYADRNAPPEAPVTGVPAPRDLAVFGSSTYLLEARTGGSAPVGGGAVVHAPNGATGDGRGAVTDFITGIAEPRAIAAIAEGIVVATASDVRLYPRSGGNRATTTLAVPAGSVVDVEAYTTSAWTRAVYAVTGEAGVRGIHERTLTGPPPPTPGAQGDSFVETTADPRSVVRAPEGAIFWLQGGNLWTVAPGSTSGRRVPLTSPAVTDDGLGTLLSASAADLVAIHPMRGLITLTLPTSGVPVEGSLDPLLAFDRAVYCNGDLHRLNAGRVTLYRDLEVARRGQCGQSAAAPAFEVTIKTGRASTTPPFDGHVPESTAKRAVQLHFGEKAPTGLFTVTVEWRDGSTKTTEPGQLTNDMMIEGATSPDGPKTWDVSVRITSADGQVVRSPRVALDLDNVPPRWSSVVVAPSSVAQGPDARVTLGDLTFAGTAADAHTLTVDWGDGTSSGPFAGGRSTFSDVSHVYAVPAGSYVVKATVQDDDGGRDERGATVTVTNRPPSVTGITPGTGTVGTPVPLDATATDPGGSGDIATYAWSVTNPDGTYVPTVDDPDPSTPGASLLSDEPGTYRVSVLVTDRAGATSSLSRDLVISPSTGGTTGGSTGETTAGTSATTTDGTATDGAATDGAATDGAATDGAATDGAATDGAATDGAASDGGTSPTGTAGSTGTSTPTTSTGSTSGGTSSPTTTSSGSTGTGTGSGGSGSGGSSSSPSPSPSPSPTPPPPSPRPRTDATTARHAGASRVETAVASSRSNYPADGSAAAVVLSRSDVAADALSGTPLAAEVDGPLLLTATSSLHAATEAELRRVLRAGGTVHLLGGPNALSAAVEQRVRDLGYVPKRHAGPSRFETAVAIARATTSTPAEVFVATAWDFQDALIAGPAAAKVGGVVVLSDGPRSHSATDSYIVSLTRPKVVKVGAPARTAYGTTASYVGTTAQQTSTLVAAAYFASATQIGAARVDVFADALSGGVHIAKRGGGIVLTDSTSLTEVVRTYLVDHRVPLVTAHVYGGPNAISEATREAIRSAIE